MFKTPPLLFLFCMGLLLIACGGYERPNSTPHYDTITTRDTLVDSSGHPAPKKRGATKITLYIENSGSMNGYISGNTDFKNALSNLLVMLKYHYGEKNIQLAFMNAAIYPIDSKTDITQFAYQLSPARMKVGNTASSNLNGIVQQVLDKTTDSTLSILLSDCIYSIEGKNTAELLGYQKSQTKDAFLSKLKGGNTLQTSLHKLTSSFNGKYWDKNNAVTVLANKPRPYYILVTGAADRMRDFNNKMDFSPAGIKGFENTLTLSSEAAAKDNYYSVLSSTYREGRFKPIRALSSATYIHGIEDVTINDRSTKPFTFALAVDLSTVPVEEEYKTHPENYAVLEGNYAIEKILPIVKKNIHPSDWIRIQEAHASHVLIVKATSGVYSNFSFAFKKQLPAWVYKTNTEDDTDILHSLDKTFGIKYMVEGIAEAYATVSADKDAYFTVTIPIRKAAGNNIGKIFVVLCLLAAMAGVGYLSVKRRNS